MKKTKFKRKVTTLIVFMIAAMAPYGAFAQNPVQGFFDAIKASLAPISQNKTVILSVVGAIGILIAIIAWGTDSTDNNPKLAKVIKGAFLLVVLIEAFFFLMA